MVNAYLLTVVHAALVVHTVYCSLNYCWYITPAAVVAFCVCSVRHTSRLLLS